MKKPRRRKYAVERNYVKVGALLQRARIRANLTQREVSQLLDTTDQLICNYEAGMAVPPLKKLSPLVRLYRLDPVEVVDLIIAEERKVMLRGILKGPKLKRLKTPQAQA